MNIDLKKIRDEEYKPSRVPFEYIKLELAKLGFRFDEQNTEVVTTVLEYFLRDKNFLKSTLVKSENSFSKGILLFGDYGIGKTMLFESLHKIGRRLIIDRGVGDFWFTTISAGSFIDTYMAEVGKRNEERRLWIKDYYKGKMYIDDLGFEKKAFNKTELLGEVLFERNRIKSPTFVTTNLTPSEITNRYGMRIGDRLPEMFNIIKWNGKSYRK